MSKLKKNEKCAMCFKKAVWYHPSKGTEVLCNSCYLELLNWYKEFKKEVK